MKILVTYSSQTGNTEKIARAIAAALGEQAVLKKTTEISAADCDGYEKILVGFWVDKSTADKATAEFLSGLHGKKVALFCTMGAHPQPPYSDRCLANAAQFLPADNELLPEKFVCIGKIAPELIEFFKKLPPEHPHHITPEKLERYAFSNSHPDAADCAAAAAFAKKASALSKASF